MVASISSVNPGFNYTLMQRLNEIRLDSLNATRGPFSLFGTRSTNSSFNPLNFVRINTAPSYSTRVVATGRENDIRLTEGLIGLQFDGKERFATSVSLELDSRGRVYDRQSGARLLQISNAGLFDTTTNSIFELSREDRTLTAEPSAGFSIAGNVSSALDVEESTSTDFELFGPDGESVDLDARLTLSGANELTLDLTDPDTGDSLFEGILSFTDEATFESLSIDGVDEGDDFTFAVPGEGNNTFDISTGDLDFSGLSLQEGETSLEIAQEDGRVDGTLDTLTINRSGELVGQFTNGETRTFGDVAFARFNNYGQLGGGAGGLFEATPESGRPQFESFSSSDFTLQTGFVDVESSGLGRQFISELLLQNQFRSPFLDPGFSSPFRSYQLSFETQGQLFDQFA